MEIIQILLATIAGTTFMTAFSYLISESFNKLFKEPVLLNFALKSLQMDLTARQRRIAGWLLHYAIGVVFVIAYHLIWSLEIMPFSWGSALVLGAASGLVGILGWMLIFSIPGNNPPVRFGQYYLQLFFAHVFFAMGATAVYMIFRA